MNKKDLADAISKDTGLTFRQSWDAINSALKTIESTLKNGDKVNLVGFGTFTVLKKRERDGRNPRTGETIRIPKSVAPKFTPAKGLKDSIKNR